MIKSLFENITYSQIEKLLYIILSSKQGDFEYIKNKYKQNYSHFEETLAFLIEIKIVQLSVNKIGKLKEINLKREEIYVVDLPIREFLINELLTSQNSYAIETSSYIHNFEMRAEKLIYKPNLKTRLRESWIRNLFIDLGLVELDSTSDHYLIQDIHHFFVKNIKTKRAITPKQLYKKLRENAIIGERAELAILEYEKYRLKKNSELLKLIEHISLRNVNAGYDIKSFESKKDSSDKYIKRYIEVKAVSQNQYDFYWTRNEIEKSKELGKKYYLYLLPVLTKDSFNINGLEIIKNPYVNVLNNNKKWNTETEEYKVWKKT
jgi:hypothetical protein